MKNVYFLNRVFYILVLSISFNSAFSQCQISSANVSMTSCFNSCDGTISLISQGGTPPFIVIHPVTSQPTTYTSFTMFTGMCAGTYTLLINNTLGTCPETIVVTVSQPTDVTASINGTAGVGCTGSLTSTVGGGTPGYTYTWFDCTSGSPISTAANPLNVCDGTYQLTVTDANGCTETTSCLTLNSGGPCNLIVSASTQTNVSCYGECDGLVLVYAQGGTPPYTAMTSSGQTIVFTSVGTLYPMCAGNYIIDVIDNAGCTASTNAVVTEPNEILITTNPTNISAFGNCDGMIACSATGGTGSYTSTWIDCNTLNVLGTTSTIGNLCAGDYALIIQDANNCTDTSACVTLGQPQSINEINSANFSIYPNPANAQFSIENTNGISYTFEILNILGEVVYSSTTPIVNRTTVDLNANDIADGTYFVRIKSANGTSVQRIVVEK